MSGQQPSRPEKKIDFLPSASSMLETENKNKGGKCTIHCPQGADSQGEGKSH